MPNACVMVVPSPDGKLAPLVLAAAKLAGVDEIYRIGGAQAVAALAYGTETIAPVSKIVGPGNAYVAAAKRLVFGTVGIDMIAGPSEVLILADKTGNPDWIAADLAGAGRARCQRAVDPDYRRCRLRPTRSRRRWPRNLKTLAARFSRRRRRGATSAPSSPSRSLDDAIPLVDRARARASGDRPPRMPTSMSAASAMPAPSSSARYTPGSDRRLCRRLQSCAADGALGAVLVGPRRARFHEAHLAPQVRPGSVARAGPRRDRAWQGRRARGACALGRAYRLNLADEPAANASGDEASAWCR